MVITFSHTSKEHALVISVPQTGTLHMINLIIIILSEYSTVFSCMSPQKRSITKYSQVTFYAISFCIISLLCDLKTYTTFWIYVIIFGLTQFGKDNAYRRLAESDATVTPLVACMDWLHCWYNQVAGVVPPSTALALFTKMSEKRKSTSPSAFPVKNQWKTTVLKRN